MPELPSGLSLVISSDVLFDHGGNCFRCPKDHFWYWIADPDIMGEPPFDPNTAVISALRHAPVPKDRDEVKKYIRVFETDENRTILWRGELLSDFPEWITLGAKDLEAWNAWLNTSENDSFLDETIVRCHRLANLSRSSAGHMVLTPARAAKP